jgi:DNA mismatch repair protein MutS
MMAQYLGIKKDYPDAILLFRMGDFYETFFEDAETASRILGIALTSRAREGEKRIPLAGVPYHAAENYVARLVRAGQKVAICDQVEDPREARGIVRRRVVEVITPGTVTSALLLEDKENNYLLAAFPRGERWGVARADLSTGEFAVTEAQGDDIYKELAKTAPAEILVPDSLIDDQTETRLKQAAPRATMTRLDEWLFLEDSAETTLKDHFGVESLAGFGCQDMPLGLGAAGAVVSYLRQSQKRMLPHLSRLAALRDTAYVEIDESSLANLEILHPLHVEDEDASLVKVLDATLTAMGGRALRAWIRNPLTDRQGVRERLEAVEELVGDDLRRSDIRNLLRETADLERLVARVCTDKAGPRDLNAIRGTLAVLPEIGIALKGSGSRVLSRIAGEMPDLSEAEGLIEKAIAEDAPAIYKAGSVIRRGFNQDLDRLWSLSGDAKKWILGLQEKERKRTGISSLKIGFNKVFGYYLEVSKPNLKLVPADYIRKQTLVGGERFVTEELKDKETEILRAEERAEALEDELFRRVRARVAEHTGPIQEAARMIAQLDVLSAFGEIAREADYVRPEITDEPGIQIIGGRHPVVERFLGEEHFVPNDVSLDAESQILIITGPNMAGKSTYLRQVALITLMAQIGSFVPAERARIGLVDKIFTRIGATDRVARGQSTFLVEMIETANILNNATPRSLVLLDEVGRGTSTFDGLSIAWAVVEYLHDSPAVRPMTLFATHYHELTDLAGILDRVRNFNIQVREYGDRIVFMRRIVEGGSDRSYGIQVARLAGLPPGVVERAGEILANLEEDEYGTGHIPRLARGEHSPVSGDIQLTLWETEKRLIRMLSDLDVENMTPVEALQELAELKKAAKKGETRDEQDSSPTAEGS